jgi:hypothetical protein
MFATLIMKNTTSHQLALAMLAIVPACSKKPVDVTAQIFVVTKSRENIKMCGLDVYVIHDSAFQPGAKSVC